MTLSAFPWWQSALALMALGAVLALAGRAMWRTTGLGKPSEHRVGGQMAGARGLVVEWDGCEGYVRADGELWKAYANTALASGEKVKVRRLDGLRLEVEKVSDHPASPATAQD